MPLFEQNWGGMNQNKFGPLLRFPYLKQLRVLKQIFENVSKNDK